MLWTIDTWMFARANEDDGDSEICRGYLRRLYEDGDGFAMNDEVWEEYRNSAMQHGTYSHSWYIGAWNKGICDYDPIYATDGEEAVRLREILLGGPPKELPVNRFHDDDAPFVILCFCTRDRHLISGDVGEGDFSEELTGWLRDDYGICFHDVAGDAPYHRPRHACTMPGAA